MIKSYLKSFSKTEIFVQSIVFTISALCLITSSLIHFHWIGFIFGFVTLGQQVAYNWWNAVKNVRATAEKDDDQY